MTSNINNHTKPSISEPQSINTILPIELQVNVLRFLNKQDSTNARATQHLWAQLTPPASECTLNLRCSKADDACVKGLIAAYKRNVGKVVSIDLSKCPNITDKALKYIAESNLPIRELNLSGCKITDQGIKYLANGNIPLTSLNLSGTAITDRGLKDLSKFPLKELILTNCNISDKGVKHLADARLPLATLNLNASHGSITPSKITDKSIRYLADAHIPLTSLDLSNSDISEAGIKLLRDFPLKELSLNHCFEIDTVVTFKYLSFLSLNKLSFCSSIRMTHEKLHYLSHLKLMHLDMVACYLEPDHLKHLSCMPLKHLNLEGNEEIQDRGLSYLSHLPLESLNLSRCCKITHAGLDHLVFNLHLKNLDLGDMHEELSSYARTRRWLVSIPSFYNSRFQHRMSWTSAITSKVEDSNVWHFSKPAARNIVDRDLNNLVLSYL